MGYYLEEITMGSQKEDALMMVRKLSEDSHAGRAFCYKALKRFDFDYQKALFYLKSDEFKAASRM